MAMRMTNIPIYDGGKDIDDFLTVFGYESEMYGWDAEARARAIKLCLKGKALAVYNDLDETKKANIAEIEKALRAGCVQPPEVYFSEFYNRTLRPGEKLGEYCRALEKLVDKACPGCEERVRSSMLRSRLISVVPNDVKNFMELINDKTWSELVKIFEDQNEYRDPSTSMNDFLKVDINKIDTPDHKNGRQRNEFGSPYTGHSERKNLEYKTNQDTRYTEKYDRKPPSYGASPNTPHEPNRKFTGVCFYCGKPGHRKIECRARNRDRNSTEYLKPSRYSGRYVR